MPSAPLREEVRYDRTMAVRTALLVAAGVVILGAACAGNDPAAPRAPAVTVPPAAAAPVVPAPTTTAVPATAARSSPSSPETTTTGAPTTSYVPDGVEAGSPCFGRAVFGEAAESPYLLPYAAGEWYLVTQSYCFAAGGHRDQLAYDFAMPIGRDVLAARAGVVRGLRQDSPDDGRGAGRHNYVFVEHEDGTVAFYAHLMQDSVVVSVGDEVEAGTVIARSGNSGLTGGPHLHFGVYRGWPPQEGRDVPVNFRNASGRLDPRRGLIEGLVYEALPSG